MENTTVLVRTAMDFDSSIGPFSCWFCGNETPTPNIPVNIEVGFQCVHCGCKYIGAGRSDHQETDWLSNLFTPHGLDNYVVRDNKLINAVRNLLQAHSDEKPLEDALNDLKSAYAD